ncbi:hypothetical protein B0H34DRAFT_649980 [Crassisporium funariophilum]|nr:hypothetical protein B0H34DRAFT_649980 [Crassisporium funariophilum]
MDEDHTREDPGSEDSFFRWDEEATLLSDLMEDAPHQTEDEKLMLLVEGLQTPFADEGKLLKKQIAETLVPTVNRVKASYKALEDKVDPSYGKGIVLFNQGCKDIDETMYEQQIDLQEAFQKTQGRVTQLFEELKEEYAIRDQLWADLKESIDDIGIIS